MKTVLKKESLSDLMVKSHHDVYSLAKVMSVSPSTIYRIINGDRGVGSDMIAKLLKAFDLSEKDFDKLFIFTGTLPNDNSDNSKQKEVV